MPGRGTAGEAVQHRGDNQGHLHPGPTDSAKGTKCPVQPVRELEV